MHRGGTRAAPANTRLPSSVWILLAATLAIAMGFGLIAPVLPTLANDMAREVAPGAVTTATSVVISSFAVLRLLWATPAGSLVGRFGERAIYISGVLVVALSSALIPFAGGYWQLLIFRALGGIGSVMFTVSAMGILFRIAPWHLRGRVSALYGATFMLGNMLGPVLGGSLAEFGVRVPFLSYAAGLVIAAIVIGLFMPAAPLAAGRGTSAAPPMKLSEAWADGAYRANLAVLFAHGWANMGVRVAVVPVFVSVVVSPSPWVAGVAMALFALGTAVMLPFSSRYADLSGRKPLIVVGVLFAATFTAVLGFAHGYAVVFAICLLSGMGVGIFNPAAQAVVADVVGSDRPAGRVIATTQMATDIGSIIGPIAVGIIIDASGFGIGFLFTGLLLGLSVIGWLRTPDTIGRTTAQSPTMER